MMYVRLWEGKPRTSLVRVPTVNHRGSTLEMVCPILPRAMQSSAKIPIGLLPIESHHYSLAME